MREYTLNYFVIILGVFLFLIPLATHFDTLLFLNPETRNVTVVYIEPSEQGTVGYMEVYLANLKLNSWEIFLWSMGAVVGIISWRIPVVWKGKPVKVKI